MPLRLLRWVWAPAPSSASRRPPSVQSHNPQRRSHWRRTGPIATPAASRRRGRLLTYIGKDEWPFGSELRKLCSIISHDMLLLAHFTVTLDILVVAKHQSFAKSSRQTPNDKHYHWHVCNYKNYVQCPHRINYHNFVIYIFYYHTECC